MAPKQKQFSESQAIAAVDEALEGLADDDARGRVLGWAVAKYGGAMREALLPSRPSVGGSVAMTQSSPGDAANGLGPRARAWMKKHDITQQVLDGAFRIDGESATLILKSVKANSKREKLRNVAALLGAMALVRTDQAKYSADEFREALKQYDAYDMNTTRSTSRRTTTLSKALAPPATRRPRLVST